MKPTMLLARVSGSGPGVFAIFVLLTLAVAALDLSTEERLSFSVFYTLPVIWLAWFGRGRGAVWGGVLSAGAVWCADELWPASQPADWNIELWNAAVRVVYLALICRLVFELRDKYDRVKTLSRTDPLTGAFNSAEFSERLVLELEKGRRFGRAFAVAYLDLDNFKTLNDSRGHQAGDEALKSLAGLLRDEVRCIDLVARLGGDEFAVLLPEIGTAGAQTAAERLQRRALELFARNGWPLSLSVGVATVTDFSGTPDEVIGRADKAMYEVKRRGKNGVEVVAL